jgi:hypothetical protein
VADGIATELGGKAQQMLLFDSEMFGGCPVWKV